MASAAPESSGPWLPSCPLLSELWGPLQSSEMWTKLLIYGLVAHLHRYSHYRVPLEGDLTVANIREVWG